MTTGRQSAGNDTGSPRLAAVTYLGSANENPRPLGRCGKEIDKKDTKILQNEAKLSFKINKPA